MGEGERQGDRKMGSGGEGHAWELEPTGLAIPGCGVRGKREQRPALTFVLIKAKWKGAVFDGAVRRSK